jgi:cellobiose-specific phosphotransferase system component IIC
MNLTQSPRANYRLWIGAYLIATFGSAALVKTGVIPLSPGLLLFAASFLLLIPLVRSVERAQEVCGSSSSAMRAYNRRMILASFAYVALLLGAVAIARYYAPPAAVRVLLAVAVAAPILFMIRAMARLLREERDEYLRMRIVEQTLIATGIVLAVTTIYGFLNVFDLAPRVDAYWAVPLWGLSLGIARLLQRNA